MPQPEQIIIRGGTAGIVANRASQITSWHWHLGEGVAELPELVRLQVELRVHDSICATGTLLSLLRPTENAAMLAHTLDRMATVIAHLTVPTESLHLPPGFFRNPVAVRPHDLVCARLLIDGETIPVLDCWCVLTGER